MTPKFLIKTRHLIGFRPYNNPFRPYLRRWPVYSSWKRMADADTLAGAKELRREYVLAEIREGLLFDREWAIFRGRKKMSVIQFGKKGVFK